MKRLILTAILGVVVLQSVTSAVEQDKGLAERIGIKRGLCVILCDKDCDQAMQLADDTDMLIYVQMESAKDVDAARQRIDAAGLYGKRIWVEKGNSDKIHLADNLADVLVVLGPAAEEIAEKEALRVLCPRGKAIIGERE